MEISACTQREVLPIQIRGGLVEDQAGKCVSSLVSLRVTGYRPAIFENVAFRYGQFAFNCFGLFCLVALCFLLFSAPQCARVQ